MPLPRPEYIQIKRSNIPEEIIEEYHLCKTVTEAGHVYIKANKGMYRLPQAGIIANQQLKKSLNENGYHQSKLVPGLWKHDTQPIQFTFVVDDFGVKYVGKGDAVYLQKVLKAHYKLTCNWNGN